MSGDSDRQLLQKLGISFKSFNTEALPIQHRETFNLIRSIRQRTLEDYSKNIASFQGNEPWRKQTQDRVKWIACRAANLISQRRNEAGWRSSLENDVFHRFRVEVAWLVLHILKLIFVRVLILGIAPHAEHGSGSPNWRLTTICRTLKPATSTSVEAGESRVTARLNNAQGTHSKCNMS